MISNSADGQPGPQGLAAACRQQARRRPSHAFTNTPLPAASSQDLLRPESENLQMRENEGGVFVGGVHQQEVG